MLLQDTLALFFPNTYLRCAKRNPSMAHTRAGQDDGEYKNKEEMGRIKITSMAWRGELECFNTTLKSREI